MRFWNNDVLNDGEGALEKILNTPHPPLCGDLSHKGRGKLALILICLCTWISAAIANPANQGISLIYQGKNEEALKVLEPLAHQSNPKAAFFASLLLIQGEKADRARALHLLEKAVSAGYGPALDTYAGYYLHGDFVAKDLHKAKMYYEIAGRRGYGPSQFNYGILCKNGEGLPLDRETAYVFLSLAADNHRDLGQLTLDATQFRNEIKPLLSSEQLSRAEETVRRLKNEIAHKNVDND